jgi:hypothetical protein
MRFTFQAGCCSCLCNATLLVHHQNPLQFHEAVTFLLSKPIVNNLVVALSKAIVDSLQFCHATSAYSDLVGCDVFRILNLRVAICAKANGGVALGMDWGNVAHVTEQACAQGEAVQLTRAVGPGTL